MSTTLARTARHLVVALKRFAYDPVRQARTKIMDRVRFPVRFTLEAEVEEGMEGFEEGVESGMVSGMEGRVVEEVGEGSGEKEVEEGNGDVRQGVVPDTGTGNGRGKEGGVGEAGASRMSRSVVYELYAAVIHCGRSALHGHYIACGRHSDAWGSDEGSSEGSGRGSRSGGIAGGSLEDAEKAEWWHMDDSVVSTTTLQQLLEMSETTATDKVPYMLFYRRVEASVGASCEGDDGRMDVGTDEGSMGVGTHVDGEVGSARSGGDGGVVGLAGAIRLEATAEDADAANKDALLHMCEVQQAASMPKKPTTNATSSGRPPPAPRRDYRDDDDDGDDVFGGGGKYAAPQNDWMGGGGGGGVF